MYATGVVFSESEIARRAEAEKKLNAIMQIMESLSPEYIGSFDSREDLEKEFRKN
jgi:hypothetical protein